MNKAILTRFMGPTNSRGSRVRASDGDNTIFSKYEHALHHTERHSYAAFTLAKSLGWSGLFVAGGTKDGFAFVCAAKDGRFPQASGMAEHGRVGFDGPLGFEREDWFFIPSPDCAFGIAETEWKLD